MFHFCVNPFKKMFIYPFKMAQLLLSNYFPFIIHNPYYFTWNHISATDTVPLCNMNKPAPVQGYSYSTIKHVLVRNLGFPQLGTPRFWSFGTQYSATLGFYFEYAGSKFLKNIVSIYLSHYMPSYPEKSQNRNDISLKTVHFSLKCLVQNKKFWKEITGFI